MRYKAGGVRSKEEQKGVYNFVECKYRNLSRRENSKRQVP